MDQTVYQLVSDHPPMWNPKGDHVAVGAYCPICSAFTQTIYVSASECSNPDDPNLRDSMLTLLRIRVWEHFCNNHFQYCPALRQYVVCPTCKEYIWTARVHSRDRTMDLTLARAQTLLAAAIDAVLATHTCEC